MRFPALQRAGLGASPLIQRTTRLGGNHWESIKTTWASDGGLSVGRLEPVLLRSAAAIDRHLSPEGPFRDTARFLRSYGPVDWITRVNECAAFD